jgi:peroxiredoxin Q/BCP
MSATVGASTGMIAPDFTLMDGDNKPWNLAEHRGKAVVLLFYPADETPVCTRQMCSVRDRWEDYSATGAEVVGISANTVESHKSFAENHKLPLTLLSDPRLEVAKGSDGGCGKQVHGGHQDFVHESIWNLLSMSPVACYLSLVACHGLRSPVTCHAS